jgi:biopolymer transport protein ExbB
VSHLARLALAAVLALPLGAQAEDASEPRAKSLDELLELVRKGRAEERRENEEREKRFLAARDQQRRLLDEAHDALAAAEQRSERLEASFNEQEQELARAEQRLRERLGTLGELFGTVRSAAGDARSTVEDSLVTAQLPGRGEFLDELARSRALPSMERLEQLWFVLQQEAVESGRVVRFPATVITADGQQVEKSVVRVGVFNAVADGDYLQFLGESGQLVELGRQPARQYRSTIGDLESATTGPVAFALDPSRGQILSLLVEVPTLRERIGQGRTIGYVILVLGAIGIALALYQLVWLVLEGRRVNAQVEGAARDDNALGRVVSVYDSSRADDVETLELKLDEAILRETPRLQRFVPTIRVFAVVAPLLGLLGTVTGMIQTFQSITLFGTGDPRMMAGGISEALVTTMLGLAIAIPLTLLHSFITGRSRSITQVLEEQSAGIVARRAESREARA